MNEHEVAEAVAQWLSSLFPDQMVLTGEAEVMVYEAEEGKMRHYARIQCKEGLAEYYKDLGQCLTYHVENDSMPTYLATPHNYANLERFKRIVHHLELPIGLVTINEKGNVKVVIKARSER